MKPDLCEKCGVGIEEAPNGCIRTKCPLACKAVLHWISVKDKLPENEGRYLILVEFIEPCISNSSIVRRNVPFVSNYTVKKGWMSKMEVHEITHWMTIPELPK